MPVQVTDINNYLNLIGAAKNLGHEDHSIEKVSFPVNQMRERLKDFFQTIQVSALQPKTYGWNIPSSPLPETLNWQALRHC